MRSDRRRESRSGNESHRVVMDGAAMGLALERLADEVARRTEGLEGRLALVGVRTRGVPLSRRIATLLEKRIGAARALELGALDIALYRDDTAVSSQPIVRRTELPFPIDDTWIVLVDDVLFSGRTTRAAIAALIDFGRPRKIELLVLVDRGGRELPIHADYTGIALATSAEETIRVLVAEEDGRDEVVLAPTPGAGEHP